MKHLPVDIHSFAKMIKDGYLYVDKTKQIANLFKRGERYFFLSRPRKFGKSLLLSTLKSLFLGEKELFQDLWLGKEEAFDWQKHPVIAFDFSLTEYATPEELKQGLMCRLDQCAKEYDVDISKGYSPKTKLELLVKGLAKINDVVFLVDEYDKPIFDHLHNPDQADAQREVLKSFYDGFKGLGSYMRCIFITGISKFSGLDNLHDISYDPRSADLVGYTEKEVIDNFSQHLDKCAEKNNTTYKQILKEVRHWYNSYQFSEEPTKVYNPYSIARFFQKQTFKNYWFASGTPTFLIEYLKKTPLELDDIEKRVFSIASLGTFIIHNAPLEALFFQAGYLTIKKYESEYNVYRLGFPNEEIRQSLSILQLGKLSAAEIKNPNLINQDRLEELEEHYDGLLAQEALKDREGAIPHDELKQLIDLS